jgi:hypothetical protein
MKISTIWNYRSLLGKIMIGLVLALMVSNIDAVPALGNGGFGYRGYHNHGRYEHRWNGYNHNPYMYGKHYYGPYYRNYGYYYGPPSVFYTPPPVLYTPPPPPGIGFFLPPIIIRP